MIKETPSADHTNLPVGQRPRHFGGSAEVDPTGRQEQLLRPAAESPGTQVLLWPQIKITHPFSLLLTYRAGSTYSPSLADRKRVHLLAARLVLRAVYSQPMAASTRGINRSLLPSAKTRA